MLKQVAILAVMPLVLIGCGEERTTTRHYSYCDSSNAMKVSDFVQRCVSIVMSAPDNPTDDVEDIIKQCENTGRRLFCPLYEYTVVMKCDALGICYEVDQFVKERK
jgi:hypothetical protein